MKKLLPLLFTLACNSPLDSDISVECASTPITEAAKNLCQTYRGLTIIALGQLHKVDGITHAETYNTLELNCTESPDTIVEKIKTQLDLRTAELCIIRPPS